MRNNSCLVTINCNKEKMAEERPLLSTEEYDNPIVAPPIGPLGRDQDFMTIVHDAILAMDRDILPQRISQGSSGSYFVSDTLGVSTN